MLIKEHLDEFVKSILVYKSEHPGSNPGQGNYFSPVYLLTTSVTFGHLHFQQG